MRDEKSNENAIGQSDDEIEGIDTTTQSDMDDYPVDRVQVRQEPATVADVMRRIDRGFYIMDPEFQRAFVWDVDRQSRLIESVLMRIPLPLFYLAEQTDTKRVVVDGLQRLTTLHRYVKNEFALRLGEKELNGKYFRDLIPKFANRIEDAYITLIILDAKMPEHIRLDIFERVNSGVPINRQQMRNCLYTGPATRWLKQQATGQPFLRAGGGGLNDKVMRDREMINRFCAFYLLGIDGYRGEIDEYLAAVLKKMNQMPESTLDDLARKFQLSMNNNRAIFDSHSFRKHNSLDPKVRRKPFNVALFDVFSVSLADIEKEKVQKSAARIEAGFQNLMADDDFVEAISRSTNSTRQVKTRFSKVQAMLSEVLDATAA